MLKLMSECQTKIKQFTSFPVQGRINPELFRLLSTIHLDLREIIFKNLCMGEFCHKSLAVFKIVIEEIDRNEGEKKKMPQWNI